MVLIEQISKFILNFAGRLGVMMKRVLSAIIACTLLICTCSVSGVAAAFETEEGNEWNNLIDNFDPFIEYQVEDVSAISEDFVEPKMSAELEMAIEEADPLSEVSYNLKTGEVSLKPYETLEKNDMVETTPSHVVSEDDYPGPYLASDNRTRIYSVTTYPYRAVVQVKAYFNNGKVTLSGTGAMVGEKTVLTAGHVVYDQDFGWASKVEIVPGGTLSGYNTYSSSNITSVKKWTEEGNFEYDYAVVELDESPGVGYFGTRAETTSNLKTDSFYTYGFPADKTSGSLWRTGGSADLIRTTQFTFHAYPTSGFSGGPVVAQDDTSYIVGILSGDSYVYGEYYGLAVRVTSDVVDFVKRHI